MMTWSDPASIDMRRAGERRERAEGRRGGVSPEEAANRMRELRALLIAAARHVRMSIIPAPRTRTSRE